MNYKFRHMCHGASVSSPKYSHFNLPKEQALKGALVTHPQAQLSMNGSDVLLPNDELSLEQLNAFQTRVKSITDEAWGTYAQLGRAKGFKALGLELAKHGLKACGSWACEHPIKPKNWEFIRILRRLKR